MGRNYQAVSTPKNGAAYLINTDSKVENNSSFSKNPN
jgi:hypothetical protein